MSEVPTRLLREAVRDRAASAESSACIDADTIAAWADGALRARERAAVESHAADCARCQALLAAMVKTAPPPPERAWWRRPAIAWVLPATAALAAVLVLVRVSDTRRATPTSTATARAEDSVAAPAQPAQLRNAPPPATAALETKTPPEAETDALGRSKASVRRQPSADEARKDPRQDKPSLQARANAFADGDARKSAAALPPPLAAPSSADIAATPAAAPSADVARESAAARPSPGARSESVAIVQTPRGQAPSPSSAVAPAAPPQSTSVAAGGVSSATLGAASRAAAGLAMKAAPAQDIVSSDRTARWRIVPGGGVERSTDDGATWQMQTTGVQVTLAAGAAPSASVCWLAGAGGVVLRSIDGRTWQRVTSPDAADLVAITATSDANATVTAVGGRTFTTTDGGLTWTRTVR